VEVAKIFGINLKKIKKAVENFSGVEGRQQFIKDYKGIKIYNDTTATTPDATVVALKSLGDKKRKNIVLIMGGADKKLDMSSLVKEVPKWCKKVILLAGTGTEKLDGKIEGLLVKNLKEGLLEALKYAKKGDILVLSPAFASFGMFKNEFDRGDKFNKLVKSLK
jgi:UDP-N-acetylmuramoylalanine--D-glutamate ligase